MVTRLHVRLPVQFQNNATVEGDAGEQRIFCCSYYPKEAVLPTGFGKNVITTPCVRGYIFVDI